MWLLVVRGQTLVSHKVQVLRPLLFSLYVAPVSDFAAAHHVSIHQYADDIQMYMYIAFQPVSR